LKSSLGFTTSPLLLSLLLKKIGQHMLTKSCLQMELIIMGLKVGGVPLLIGANWVMLTFITGAAMRLGAKNSNPIDTIPRLCLIKAL
jgi:hypothetical protein